MLLLEFLQIYSFSVYFGTAVSFSYALVNLVYKILKKVHVSNNILEKDICNTQHLPSRIRNRNRPKDDAGDSYHKARHRLK